MKRFKYGVIIAISVLLTVALCSCGDDSDSDDYSKSGFTAELNNSSGDLHFEIGRGNDAGDELRCGYPDKFVWITESWLPMDMDKTDGEHSTNDYFAYTFYITNTSDADASYEYSMRIGDGTQEVNEAIRIMVIKNGSRDVYAKACYDNRDKAEKGTEKWVDDNTVFSSVKSKLSAGSADKYTVVIWAEGDDNECTDATKGGQIGNIKMTFDRI